MLELKQEVTEKDNELTNDYSLALWEQCWES